MISASTSSAVPRLSAAQTYEIRAGKLSATRPAAARLFSLVAAKRTNLCVAVDVPTTRQLLQIARAIAPHVCMIKTHVDLMEDWDASGARELRQLADGDGDTTGFLVFEDRKFADIGATNRRQYEVGGAKTREWADVVTVHAIAGVDAVSALAASAKEWQAGADGRPSRGCFVLAELSCHGNLITPEYTQKALDMLEGDEGSAFIAGYIASRRHPLPAFQDTAFITPGVHLHSASDAHGQRYRGVKEVVGEGGSDVIVVGRGVIGDFCKDGDVAALVARAGLYRDEGWKAYEERIARNDG